jgi:1,4-dihydroxy-6-naphthoate synthase
MNGERISLAISTCPNDTFAFHAILKHKIDLLGLKFDIQLLDIQQLNDGLFGGQFDIAKSSFHAAVLLAAETFVLPAGSAMGFGVGPLLLAAQADTCPGSAENQITLCPGRHTTATLLFQMFYANQTRIKQTVFSEIMPALKNRSADFGVCIHEGRFTYQNQGLALVEDLGMRWESTTDCPLPLGGLLARRSIQPEKLKIASTVIRRSIEYGINNRGQTLPTMRQYSQELDDDVIFQHVDLYVNDWTVDLGQVGRAALRRFATEANRIGISPRDGIAMEVFEF